MEDNVSIPSVALRNGLLLGAAFSAWQYFLNSTGLYINQAVTMLGVVIFIGGLVWTLAQYKTLSGGYASLGQLFGLGVLTSAVAAFLKEIFVITYVKVINPDFSEEVMSAVRTKLEETPGMTEETIETSMAMAERFSNPFLSSLFEFFMILVTGLILSLIIALIMKKNPPGNE